MKDLMGVELQDGDLIADIRTNYAWITVGVLSGGQTPTGKLRYLTLFQSKNLTQEKFILKISPQTALDWINRKYEDNDYPTGLLNFIDELNERIAHEG